MPQKINKYLLWTPRILAILLILFLVMFSLDIFDMSLTGWQLALGLFMHNLPSLILTIVLIISWKYEIVGGVIFITAAILFTIFTFTLTQFESIYVPVLTSLSISLPALLIGNLFIVVWFQKKKL